MTPTSPDPNPALESATSETSTPVEATETGKTIPKSLRLSEVAFSALTVLEGKYPALSRAAIVSKAVLSYATKATAAPIMKYRMLHHNVLFRLQAAATDVKTGLQSLNQQLFEARKSNRGPEALKIAYETLTVKQVAVLDHAEETLANMDRECLLADILTGDDHALLTEIIEELEKGKPTTHNERKKRALQLKILQSLLP